MKQQVEPVISSEGSFDSSDSFDPHTFENVFIDSDNKSVYGGGEFGTAFIKRPINTHADDTYNFKITRSKNMNIRIGCYLVKVNKVGNMKAYDGQHFWCYNL